MFKLIASCKNCTRLEAIIALINGNPFYLEKIYNLGLANEPNAIILGSIFLSKLTTKIVFDPYRVH